MDEIAPGGKIPSVRNGEFNRWFNDLTSEEFDKVWADPALRTKIEDRIRQPKGLHEWCMVCRADDFKRSYSQKLVIGLDGRHIMAVLKTPSVLWRERDMPHDDDYHSSLT